jgi:protein TonB
LSLAVFGLVLIMHIAGAVMLRDLRAHPQRIAPPEPVVVTLIEVAESVSSADAAMSPPAEPVRPAAQRDPPEPTRNPSRIPPSLEAPAQPRTEDLAPVPPQPQPRAEPIVPQVPAPPPEIRLEPSAQPVPAPPPTPPAMTPPSAALPTAGPPDPPGRPGPPQPPSPPASTGTQAVAAAPPRFDVAYLDNPKPAYPLSARRMQLEGTVRLRVLVNAAGKAEQVELQATSGSPVLDRSAMDAVRRWRFVPARRGEEAVPAWVVVPIVFTLNG